MQPVAAPEPAKRDPAPTRLAYRLHRLWLTPLFRSLLRVGLPSFCMVFAVGWYLADQQRREELGLVFSDLRRAIEERPEFMVKLMAIDGASGELDQDIREIVPLDFPVSSFDLELEEMRRAILGLDAVAGAGLQIRPGGILQVSIQERIPTVIWRSRDGLELLDGEGHRVAPLGARTDRPDLPLIAGDGADAKVAEALALIEAARPLAGRLRGLVRMGERRWDVVLDRDQRILLPERGAVEALERVIALDQAEDMLERDLMAVDMRNADRPTLRMSPEAVEELRRVKTLETGAIKG
ncbi:MAG: cell division protein FtsQ [Confluentimicrobium sp.]|uniref:cell division protein FtsQ/DivIB n=1 Tax=Actibacterium sp. TaxID=1872125 RepID=UPI000C577A07|nr:cell division protein FtsQ/DivIB [Actibacterium sp.]MBC55813.1 cell division protein FtsQ [Actibacterium sp.]|tara:strand:- start:978 stop:1865 length:888 start_codon:yes stop_codon:yes gene_type:complete